MPGRPPKPRGLHVIEGTYRADRHAKIPAIAPDKLGNVPRWFDAEMRAEWARVTKDPVLREILNHTHRPTIIHHCVLYKRFVQDARGERPMPAAERQTFHSIQMQLGWTPASQSKLRVPDKPAEGNRFGALRTA